jgi:type III pantothenate kinase
VTGLAVCSVVPELSSAYRSLGHRLLDEPPLLVEPATVPDLPVLALDPASVGADRLANAVAVRSLHGAPAIVVDLGTATTYDVVSAKGEYAGGVIVPGILTAAQALFQRGARLARVEVKRPERVVGRTTEESIQAGIFLSAVGGIDSLVRAIIHEQGFPPDVPVVATGGLAELVSGEAETITAVDPALTLTGVRLVWETNRGG